MFRDHSNASNIARNGTEAVPYRRTTGHYSRSIAANSSNSTRKNGSTSVTSPTV